jgi:F0F1-type ATP synthase assembly protein I
MGLTSALLLIGALGLGWLADSVLNTLPVFTLVGLALGIVLAGRYTYVNFRKFFRD